MATRLPVLPASITTDHSSSSPGAARQAAGRGAHWVASAGSGGQRREPCCKRATALCSQLRTCLAQLAGVGGRQQGTECQQGQEEGGPASEVCASGHFGRRRRQLRCVPRERRSLRAPPYIASLRPHGAWAAPAAACRCEEADPRAPGTAAPLCPTRPQGMLGGNCTHEQTPSSPPTRSHRILAIPSFSALPTQSANYTTGNSGDAGVAEMGCAHGAATWRAAWQIPFRRANALSKFRRSSAVCHACAACRPPITAWIVNEQLQAIQHHIYTHRNIYKGACACMKGHLQGAADATKCGGKRIDSFIQNSHYPVRALQLRAGAAAGRAMHAAAAEQPLRQGARRGGRPRAPPRAASLAPCPNKQPPTATPLHRCMPRQSLHLPGRRPWQHAARGLRTAGCPGPGGAAPCRAAGRRPRWWRGCQTGPAPGAAAACCRGRRWEAV